MGNDDALAPGATFKSLTSTQIKEYLYTLFYGFYDTDADSVERTLKCIKWPYKIDKADARVTKY